jgi:hypothetical protein
MFSFGGTSRQSATQVFLLMKKGHLEQLTMTKYCIWFSGFASFPPAVLAKFQRNKSLSISFGQNFG